MKQTIAFGIVSVGLLVSACSSGGGTPAVKTSDLIDQAKQNCTAMGYVPNTREHVDCTSQQFNAAQQRTYGPMH